MRADGCAPDRRSERRVRTHSSGGWRKPRLRCWYQRRSIRAAEMFIDELDRAIERIRDHAGQFPEYAAGTRRIVLPRFPYIVVFRETAAGIEIIAIAHGRRRPGYWRDRAE